MSLVAELKRRNVFRVGIAYAVVAWLVLQVADVMIDNIGAPDWLFKAIVMLLAIGLPVVLVFAWAFELTPEGIKRDHEVDRSQSIAPQTGRRLDRTIIVVLVLALGWFAWDKFSRTETPEESVEMAAELDPSIAVLPFVNMSPDPDNEYFSDGLSEELLNLLAKVDGLKVAARTSTFKFKGADADIAEIGAKLGVATVLEGSVRKAGDQVRITAQLIQVDDGFHLWSETYDRELDNIFAVQDEIARAIVGALKLPLLGEDAQPVTTQTAASFEAYDLYLLGRHHERLRNAEGYEKAIDYYSRAVALDSGYAPAWSGLATAYLLIADFGGMPTPEANELARKAIDKALAIDSDSSEALSALGLLYRYAGQTQDAIDVLQRAVDEDPDNIRALMQLSAAMRDIDPSRGEELARRAWELDPLSEETQVFLVNAISAARGPQAAIDQARALLLDDPDNPGLHESLGNIYRSRGELNRAIAEYELTHRLRPGDAFSAAWITMAYLNMDDEASAAQWADKTQERAADSRWATLALDALHYYRGEYESILSQKSRELEHPEDNYARTNTFLAEVMMKLGRKQDAEKLLRVALEVSGVSDGAIADDSQAFAAANLAHLLSKGEERSELLEQLQAYIDDQAPLGIDQASYWELTARLAALEGRRQDFLQALDQAFERGLRGARWMERDPLFEGYADDPGFREFVLKLEATSKALRAENAEASG